MMYYKTSEIAKAVGVHPNTVRLYEEWRFLQPVPRNEKGYRLYTDKHLDQMRLARTAFRCEYIEGDIRKSATVIVKTAAEGKLEQALEEAFRHLQHVKNERVKAEEALLLIQRWINGEISEGDDVYIKRNDVAKLLGISIDVLRNWERNGLICIPRNKYNNYRIYGSKEINRLKVIRTLRIANYSMMAILRMMRHIDLGEKNNYIEILNTPQPHEDIISATDRWISALMESEADAERLICQLKSMIKK